MGYTTDFFGEFTLTPSLTQEQSDYINKFSGTRRMKRDVNKLMDLFKGKDGFPNNTGSPSTIYGQDGEYFVGGLGSFGQDRDDSVIDGNNPPSTQPGLWCQWVVGNDGNTLEWDGGEKFYSYTEWLEYLIENFFKPWGIKVNGEVEFQGEERDDMGKIVVKDNDVTELTGRVDYR